MRGRRLAPFVIGLLVAAACSDPNVPPDGGDDADGIQFTDGLGRAFATAGLPSFSEGELNPADFAIAIADSIGGLVLSGFQLREGTSGDLFILQLTENRAGQFGPCHQSADCHGRLLLGIDAANIFDVDSAWELIAGTVTITATGNAAVAGSFEDLVFERQPAGGATLTIEQGTFRVPLLTDEEARSFMECFLERATGGDCA